jgi:sirohydrochlorin ferrochelatase
MTPLVLLAHGSRDPRAAEAIRSLVRAVARLRPGLDVREAYLDHAEPSLDVVCAAVSAPEIVVVPLLLTEAYHGRVDVPAATARAAAGGVRVRRAAVLGPGPSGPVHGELVAALRRRITELGACFDALVLASAGTRSAAARSGVSAVAAALGDAMGVPCIPAYASATRPDPAEAVALLRARGARSVAMASYFLAPGRLHDRALTAAFAGGAVAASAPLGGVPELARLVLARSAAAAEPAEPAELTDPADPAELVELVEPAELSRTGRIVGGRPVRR